MHVLHLTTFLQGGAGRIITALAVAQRQAGHEVTLVADDGGAPGYASYPEYLRQLADAGVRVLQVRSTFTRDLNLNTAAAARLRRVVDAHPVSIAHSHAAIPALIAQLTLGGRPSTRPSASLGTGRVPIVHTMHGWGIAKTPEQTATDLTLLGMPDVVVTPSAASRDALMTLGLRDVPFRVIPYGIDAAPATAEVDEADRAAIASLRGRTVALCLGTIGERKNQALLVSALARNPRASAVFIGDGDAAGLQQAAEQAGVADRVRILGYRPEASRYLAHADVLVLPSRNEGLPIAVLEAFRGGVPVVASDIPELAEAVDDGVTGVLFAPDDAGELAASLDRVANPLVRSRLRASAKAVFAAQFSAERMIDAYARLYAGCLMNRVSSLAS